MLRLMGGTVIVMLNESHSTDVIPFPALLDGGMIGGDFDAAPAKPPTLNLMGTAKSSAGKTDSQVEAKVDSRMERYFFLPRTFRAEGDTLRGHPQHTS